MSSDTPVVSEMTIILQLIIYADVFDNGTSHHKLEIFKCAPGGVEHILHWCHNGRNSVSNHQPHACLLNRLFRRKSKKTSKLHVTGLCLGNSPVTSEFPAKMASNAENVFISWRHNDQNIYSCVEQVIVSLGNFVCAMPSFFGPWKWYHDDKMISLYTWYNIPGRGRNQSYANITASGWFWPNPGTIIYRILLRLSTAQMHWHSCHSVRRI